MPASQKLEVVQAQLRQRGVRDVKLHMNGARLHEQPASVVADQVADFLGAYLAGDFVVVAGLGDAG